LARRSDPRPDRRLQMLPPRSARNDRSRRGRGKGLRIPDRADLSRDRRRLHRCRGADPVPRQDGRQVEDEPRNLPGGRTTRAVTPDRKGEGPTVTELDETNFDAAVAGGPVLVDFWAPWCRPCKTLEPILASLPVAAARVNIDEHPGIASRFDVL